MGHPGIRPPRPGSGPLSAESSILPSPVRVSPPPPSRFQEGDGDAQANENLNQCPHLQKEAE